MTVNELIERLEEIAEQGYGDTEVMGAIQPSYPLVVNFDGVASPQDIDGEDEDGDEDEDDKPMKDNSPVWLVMGDQPYTGNPYASRKLWDAAC